MSTSDGTVLGVTKIVDHGANATHWNLVILSDGYRASEMDKYHDDVRAFVTTLYNTAPFNELWCGINIHRVDVTSTDSGADDPVTCGGTGATRATYFDSTFCADGVIRRLLSANQATALAVATAQVPEMNQTLVIVNSPIYGGAGGTVATTSTDASSAQIAIHEIGHSAFGLADEYFTYQACGVADPGHDHYAGGEPFQPNITINTDRNTMKWRTLVLPATPMPTMENPDCTQCPDGPSPVAAGTVGTFEGAYYHHCDVYRPVYSCKMRILGAPFCPVCAGVIRAALTPYVTPTTVTLTTPSISFTDIPEGIGGMGVTTYRAIVFEVSGCETRTFNITAGPTGGFGTPLGTSVVVPPAETTPITHGRLWLSYTSTTAGANAMGSVTVQCVQTGQIWVININANTVARQKAAVVLVLDRSGSMSDDPGDNTTKIAKLKQAATSFIEVMLDGDGISIVRFDDTAQRLMDVTDVGPAGSGARMTAIGHINGLTPGGATSIGDGIQKGRDALNDGQAVAVPPYDTLGMLILSDGMENTPPMIADVAGLLNAHTFAIGFGLPEDLDVNKLDALTQGHSGYLVVTGAITPSVSHRLTKYFLQILADVTNADVILDPSGNLSPGAEHRIPFEISEADYGADVILLSPLPGFIDFELETPSGLRITPASLTANAQYVEGQRTTYYRLGLPADPGSPEKTHYGTWHAVLRFAKKDLDDKRLRELSGPEWERLQRTGTIPYDLVVHAYSNLTFDASLIASGTKPGSLVKLKARLAQYGIPLERAAKVWADVEAPDGSTDFVPLQETSPGSFSGEFVAPRPGVYRARIRAVGSTREGDPFTREKTLTAAMALRQNDPNRKDEAKLFAEDERRDRKLRKEKALDIKSIRKLITAMQKKDE